MCILLEELIGVATKRIIQENMMHTFPFTSKPLGLITLFFLPKTDPNPVLKFTWDDGTKMLGKFEGSAKNYLDGKRYPKQISSFPHKDLLGKYLRDRMGIYSSRRVTIEDFNAYGRSDIEITQIGPGEYLLNFSV